MHRRSTERSRAHEQRRDAIGAMTGKTVVITGPTSGIGKEIARGLAKLGANLVLGCRDTVAGTALAAELGRGNDGSVIEVVPVDLARGH